ncbi:HAD hydrolase-like protein [Persephonella sp.]
MTTRNQTRLLQLLKEADTLLFDMDNTILDLEELNFYVFKTAIEKYTGLKYTKEDYLKYTLGYRFPENIVLFLQANGLSSILTLFSKFETFDAR